MADGGYLPPLPLPPDAPPPPVPPPPKGVASARYGVSHHHGWQQPWLPKQPMHPPSSHGSHSTSLKIDKAMTLGKLNILAF